MDGPRCDARCTPITSSAGYDIAWVQEMRYLGVYITKSRVFKCSLDHAKRSFYRAENSILSVNFGPPHISETVRARKLKFHAPLEADNSTFRK